MTTLITDVRSLDTLDDRREVWSLLARLSPRERYQFLAWACRQCYLPNSRIHPTPSWFRMGKRITAAMAGDQAQDAALTNEVYTDLFMLVMQFGLSAVGTARKLEECVRRGCRSALGPFSPGFSPCIS